jgi:hypothetical protein
MNPKMCGAGAPARERREVKDKPDAPLPLLVRSFRVIVATLREIFDESAYARFLIRHQLTPSRDSYAAFQNDYEQTKMRRPRCC